VSQQLGFKSGGSRRLGAIQELVYHGRKFDTVDQFKQSMVLECRTATDHGASLITTSDNGNVVCSVSRIEMAGTLNIRFTNYLYCKIIVVTDVVLKHFLHGVAIGPTARLSLSGSDLLIRVAPSGVLDFHWYKNWHRVTCCFI